ncbi:MAG: type II secretion system minor pseudopilin GspJ [Pseudohongiellaceae bacterium]
MSGRSPQQGFSLVEVLVAMAVTALIGALAWLFVDAAVDATGDTGQVLERMQDIESTWAMLSMDLQQTVEDGARPGAGPEERRGAVFRGGLPAPATPFLSLVRDGWTNLQELPRSELQRVAYRFEDGELWRDSRPMRNLPHALRPAPVSRLLMDDLQAVTVRFLPATAESADQGWLTAWPGDFPAATEAPGDEDMVSGNEMPSRTLPLAVEVTLELEGIGELQRLFILPGR